MFWRCEEEATAADAVAVGCHGDDAVYGRWRRRPAKVQPL